MGNSTSATEATRAERRQAFVNWPILYEGMDELGFDGLVACSAAGTFYLSGGFLDEPDEPAFARERLAIVVVPRDGDPIYIVCASDEARARASSYIEDVRTYPDQSSPVETLATILTEVGLRRGRLGFEHSFLPIAHHRRLVQRLPEATLVDADDILARARALKMPAEIERIQHAVVTADHAVHAAWRRSGAGDTERQVQARMSEEFIRRGSEQFHMRIASGPYTHVIHHDPSDRQLERGDLLSSVFVAFWDSYWSDNNRMATVGPPSSEQRDRYQVVYEALMGTIDRIKPGIEVRELYDYPVGVFARHGDTSHHSHMGHGMSRGRGQEKPIIQSDVRTLLEPNMVFMLEQIYRAGSERYMQSHLVQVTETGHRVLDDWWDNRELFVFEGDSRELIAVDNEARGAAFVNWSVLREAMERERLDTVVAADPQSVLYLTGSYVDANLLFHDTLALAVVPRVGPQTFIVWNLEEAVVRSTSWVDDIRPYVHYVEGSALAVADVLTEKGLSQGRIGFEERFINTTLHRRIQGELPQATFVEGDHVIRRARARKMPAEVDLLRQVARLSDEAGRAGWMQCHADVTEYELAMTMAREMFARGGYRVSHVYVAAGANTHDIRHKPGTGRLEPGDIFASDFGFMWNMYGSGSPCWSDLGRMGVVGEPSPRQRELYRLLRDVELAVVARMKPGVRCCDLYTFARDTYLEAGVDEVLPDIGHSMPRSRAYEEPLLHPLDTTPLEPGMAFTVAPSFRAGTERYAIKDLVHVTETGGQILSDVWDTEDLFVLA